MATYEMEMVLEYAKVFPENADMGDPNGEPWQVALAEKGGQYAVNAYFTNEEDITKLLSEGLNPKPMGNPRILEGEAEYGIGKYMKLKRLVSDNIKVFTDKKGKSVEKNYGGPIAIVNLTEGEDNKRWWSFEEDGSLGNGTKAKVIFDVYSNGSGVRPNAIGVIEHVPWNPEEDNSVGDWAEVV